MQQAPSQTQVDERTVYDEKPAPRDEPFSHHIFEDDPKSKASLRIYFKILFMITVLITLTIWGILSIYWGANWRFLTGIHKMNGWIVDFDGGPIGATITQAFMNNTGSKEQIDWYTVPASMFPNGEADVADAIVNERAWAAVTIHSGASDRLNAALSARNGSGYDNQVASAYAVEARNENSYVFFVQPQIQTPLEQAVVAYPQVQAQRVGSGIGDLLTTAPNLVFAPVNYTIVNLRPFDIQVGTAIDFVGLIYMLILSFIAALGNFNARVLISGLERRLKLTRLIMLRIVVPVIIYFWLSLAYALLSIYFHVPFDRRFGHAGFVIFWMLSWCAMLSLGLAIEAMITILTLRFIPFFLVPWIITNVSVVFFPIEILPTIFRYGYAMPFYNVSRAVRTILFRTRDQVGLNFGVLIAWIVVSLVSIPLAQAYVRRKQVAEWRASQHTREDAHLGDSEASITTTQG
ncbi:SNG1 family protein [Phanerochaete sordida]|uniref:SNG1 family protein n=1 Tax=Phanerochaete sordida TaxID=48140 RepID=A0A9P3GJF0_9APHY|nr:SNG1 family protein [Phanerochaete sordida]